MNAILQETQAASFQPYETVSAQSLEEESTVESINIKLRADVFDMLSAYCKEEGLSKEEVAADLIREYIEDYIEGERYDKSCVEEVESIIAEVEAGRMELIPAEEVYRKLGI